MSKSAYIGVGSNLGDKLENCRSAVRLVGRIPGCRLTGQSDFFRTSPVGVEGQGWYVNSVIALESEISVRQLLKSLLTIEADLGRKRKKKWDSRTIDLDILLFGHDVMDEHDLTVPHPYMHLRKFVLVPMIQLAPDLIHPVLGKTMSRLLEGLSEEGQTIFPMAEV
jgi:2-amino-4-hydroxy-6-hydroxymethyldihydropteridine diphosphokinase